MSLETEPLRMMSFPEWAVVSKSDPRALELMKRCNDSRALAMFRLDDTTFLFCYAGPSALIVPKANFATDCAFYTDKHGDPIPERLKDVVDWQGTPRAVALYKGYVLAFDDSFIEIRHAMTGRLVQIIKGREVSCTFDGLSVSINAGLGTGESDGRVHVAINLGRNHYTLAEMVLC